MTLIQGALSDNMLAWFSQIKFWLKEWAMRIAHSRYAVFLLGIISFTESIVVPIPTDFILTPLVMLRPKKWWLYGLVATLTSVAGGVVAYFIGAYFFNTFGQEIFAVYHMQDDFLKVQALFDKNTFVAMFISAFTFIPYKVFAIAGGIFKINLASFIVASLLGRSLRFMVEAYVMHRFGQAIGRVMYRYFALVVMAVLILAVIGVYLFAR